MAASGSSFSSSDASLVDAACNTSSGAPLPPFSFDSFEEAEVWVRMNWAKESREVASTLAEPSQVNTSRGGVKKLKGRLVKVQATVSWKSS